MKKLAIFLLMVFCWTNLTIIVKGEEAESSLPDSKAYIVTENSTGTVLSEYNADERLAPASLTKIMLLLLIAEEVNAGRLSFDEQVKTSAHASSMEGSVIWLEPGETMSVSDLVKSVVISSANDSTVTLAEH
ncbi:MAG: serine hydrolase, partial [Oscillospiraceae bacterium]|nr:serine hydrolase [Oscillospiraceae bacterium]